MNPIEAALFRRDRGWKGRSRLAESNGHRSWAAQFLQPVSTAPAAVVNEAWKPVRAGQSIPMLGEEVGYVEPRYRR